MAKLTERVAIDSADISDDDLIHIVHDAGGTPISYKMTVAQLKTFISAITGSGVNDQIAVYNGTDTIEGDTSLTWDGNTITVTGDVSNKAQLKLDSDSNQNALVTLNTNGGSANSLVQFQISDLTKYMIGINGEDVDATNEMLIITNGDSFDDDGVIVMKPNGNVGIGLGNSAEPSANKLEIGASDTTNASLKIREQSGTPTTPESGQMRNDAGSPMWYDGTQWVDLAGGGGVWSDDGGGKISYSAVGASVDVYEPSFPNTYGSAVTIERGFLMVGDNNTIGHSVTATNVSRSVVFGDANILGSEANAGYNIISGSGNDILGGDFNGTIGQNNIIKGNKNFSAGATNLIYGDNNISLGTTNTIGATSANVSRSVAIGEDVFVKANDQIVIGFGVDTNATYSATKGIFVGIEDLRPSSGWFADPSITKAANFAVGGRETMRTDVGVIKPGTGAGVFYLTNYSNGDVTEPTANAGDSVAMYAKDRTGGKSGLKIKAEDGTNHFFSDFSAIGGDETVAEANKTLTVKGTGTTSATSSLKAVNSSGTNNFEVKDNGVINASNLPTSSAGLSSGDIYNDAGTLKIV